MVRNIRFQVAAVVAVGAMLGYVIAWGWQNPKGALWAAGAPPGAQLAAEQAGPRFPITGKAGPLLEPLDGAVVTMMNRHGIPGGALAIAKDGKLVFAHGYGWANLATEELVQPNTRFGVASLSKTVTAMGVLKLVDDQKLSLDDKAFGILDHIKPPPGAEVDPRLGLITIRQLLNHSGGWDRQTSGDPVNWTTQIQLKMGNRNPVTVERLISFTMGLPLDFDPGSACKYSNFGYVVLGAVIEKVSGQAYETHVREKVLGPMGIKNMALHPPTGEYFKNEARRYLAGTTTGLPAWEQPYLNAAGGWTASALDLARLMTALEGSRGRAFLSEKTFVQMIAPPPLPLRPRPDGSFVGLGWDNVVRTERTVSYFKDGSWYGMRGFMKRLPTGANCVLLFNASMQPDIFDSRLMADAMREVHQAVERMEKYPDVDLFDDFR